MDKTGIADRVAGSRSIGRFESGAWRGGALLDHFLPQLSQTGPQFRAARVLRSRPCADDQINGGQCVLMQPEGFTDYATDVITLYASASDANRYRKTETRSAFVVQERSHAKESITKPPPVRIDRIKVRLAAQTPFRGESKPTPRPV